MNPSPSNPRNSIRILLLSIAAMVVGAAAITQQSLWMDEGSGAFKALIPDFKTWWAMTMRLGGSDTQMPVYMFLLWVWAQLGAISEFALRAINLPWLILAVLALRNVRFWPLVCLTSPFVLYYTGELRPYAMQIAAGAVAAAAMGKIIAARERQDFSGLHVACFAGLLLASSSLTAAVWAAGLSAGIVIIRPDWLAKKAFWFRVLPWLAGGLVIASYYAFTLFKGYRATGIEGGGILSVFFGFYEMIGLLGLGPGRNELRAGPSTILPSLAILIPAALCIGTAWVFGFKTWFEKTPARCVAGVACAVLLPILVLTAVGLLQDFRVLGRHFSPAMPAVLLPIALAFSAGGRFKSLPALAASLAVAFMLASSIGLRILERHARDDYRTAANLGIDALEKGRSVWWQADMNATRYYAYRRGGMPLVNDIQLLESEPPTSLMFADMVVINRPDLRHAGNNYRAELKRNLFKPTASFTGFEVWETK